MSFFGILLPGRMAAMAAALAGIALWAGAPAAQTQSFFGTDDWRSLRQPSAAPPPVGARAVDPAATTPQAGIGTPAQATVAGRPAQATLAGTPAQATLAGTPAATGPLPTASRPFDRTEVDPDFRLGPGDVLLVNVLEDPTLDTEVLVRPDGLITVPLAGTVRAAGRTPEEVAAAIRQALAGNFVEPPTVSVVLRALAPAPPEETFLTIYVIGQVNRPGQILVEEPIGFLQALALAGGVGIFADADEIQVRQVDEWGVEKVLVLDYEAIEKGAVVPKVLLDDGDTIVVPERGLFD